LYAASAVREAGYSVALFDAMLAESEKEWAAALREHKPRYAVIYEDSFNYLVQKLHYKHQKPLLACIPRDLLGQVRDFALYNEVEPRLSEEMLDVAWNNYYARDEL
jgi:hypothetical protein